MAAVVRETGATGLPLTKESLEGILLAAVSRMGVLAVVRLETTRTDVLQRNLFVILVFV